MKLNSNFKNLDWSQSLVDYAAERFSKIEKVELKSLNVHMVVSAERHKRCVEVIIHAYEATYRATAYSDDYYASVDKVFHKIKSQLVKRKNKLQDHHYAHSTRGEKWAYTEPQTEPQWEGEPLFEIKKTG